jgi:glucokinase
VAPRFIWLTLIKTVLVKEEKFPSQHYDNLNEILKKFIDQPAEKSCLAIAGPIDGRKCRMT